jgi:acetylglutamate synthase
VFWYGLESFGEIERCVAFCRDLPPSLKDAVVAA